MPSSRLFGHMWLPSTSARFHGPGHEGDGCVHVVILPYMQVRQEELDKEIPYQSRILGQTTNQNSFVL